MSIPLPILIIAGIFLLGIIITIFKGLIKWAIILAVLAIVVGIALQVWGLM